MLEIGNKFIGNALAQISDMVVIVDTHGKIQYSSPSLERILGYVPDDLIGKSIAKFVPLTDLSALDGMIQQAAQAAGVVTCAEFQFRHHDGSWRHLEAVARAHAEGTTPYVVVTSRDFTYRKRIEEELKASQARLQLITDNISDLVTVVDLTGIRQWVSPSHTRILGYTPNELLGQPITSLVHPEDIARAQDAMERTIQTSALGRVEIRTRHFDGHYLWQEAIGKALFDERGALVGGVITSRDITERKHAEDLLARYANRLENLRQIDQAILMARSLDEIVRAVVENLRTVVPSSVSATVLLVRQADNEATAYAHDLVDEAKDATTRRFSVADFKSAPAIQEQLLRGQVYTLGADALAQIPPITLLLQSAPARIYTLLPLLIHGELIGAFVLGTLVPEGFTSDELEIAREITDSLAGAIQQSILFDKVREGRERLQRLSQQLLAVQEGERRVIARELHDQIGQSLTALKLSLQAALTRPEATVLREMLEENLQITDRTLQLARDLSLELRPSLLDDLGLVSALRWYVDRQALRGGFRADFRANPLDPRPAADVEIACYRVAQQALTNVIRHAQAHQVWVELAVQSDVLRLTIRDDGKGFDVRAALERATAGASMGLLTMRERAVLLGGQIEITSAPGRGTELRAEFSLGTPGRRLERRKARD